MKVQKEHKKSTLLQWTKEELANYCIMLEHNINAINESFDNQYNNCLKIIDDMKLINETYFAAKQIIEQSINKESETKMTRYEDCWWYGKPIDCPANFNLDTYECKNFKPKEVNQ